MIIKNPLIIKKAKLQAKTATPTTSKQTIVADSNYDGLSSVEISAVDHTIDSNITAENIKKDVTILGVTGTLESGGGTSKLPQFIERTLTEITADDLSGVTNIGSYAFFNYAKLTSVTIGNSVESIGTSAFEGCSGLTGTLTIPDNVTDIGVKAFYSCSKLTSIMFGNGVTKLGTSAFEGCSGLTGTLTIPDNVTDIKSLNIFSKCTGLTSIMFGNGITTIGAQTFQECTGLESIIFSNSVTTIGSSAFYKCSGLTSVAIPNSVNHIYLQAFHTCTSLKSVTIGNGVTDIGQYVFGGCKSLTEITILATTPPKVYKNAIPSNVTTIYIPAGTLSAYQSATNWSSFASKFVELSA